MNDLKKLSEKITDSAKMFKRYLPVLFIVLLALVYGTMVYRVNVLNQAEPTAGLATTQTKTAQVPRIDPNVINQLKNLQDNSVNVKSLFDQARSNPFDESTNN